MEDFVLHTTRITSDKLNEWKSIEYCDKTKERTNCVENVLQFLEIISPYLARQRSILHENIEEDNKGTSINDISQFLNEKTKYNVLPKIVDKANLSKILERDLDIKHGTILLLLRKHAMGHAVVIARYDENNILIIDPQMQHIINITSPSNFINYLTNGGYLDNQFMLLGKTGKKQGKRIHDSINYEPSITIRKKNTSHKKKIMRLNTIKEKGEGEGDKSLTLSRKNTLSRRYKNKGWTTTIKAKRKSMFIERGVSKRREKLTKMRQSSSNSNTKSKSKSKSKSISPSYKDIIT